MLRKYIYLIVNLLLLIPSIIIVYTYAYNYINKEVILLEKKNTALEEMQSIYSIITNLQKIRGLSNITEVDLQIDNKIKDLEDKNYLLVNKIQRENIKEILQRHPKGSIADFHSYTSDIEALLLIYKLTAYNARLTLNSDIKEYLLSKNITSRLPYIIEYFARIRGLASSVKDHTLEKSIKNQIKNQLYMVKELLKNAQEMEYFNNAQFINNLLKSQQKEIHFIENELLNKEYITSNGLEIFNNITQNINFLNKLYYTNVDSLKNYYNKTIEKKNFIKALIILVCILSIFVVIFINLFYYSKIQKYIKKVEHLNIIDPMTQLYNRRFLENFIEKFVSQAQREGELFTILMIDIDFFKKVNDTYGHAIGDKVIIKVAEVLQQSTRKSDLAIRYGGEEFMVLLHATDAQSATIVTQKIKNNFESIEFTANNGETFHKTLSIGVSEFPKDSNEIWECIKLADKALYRAKESGRNRVVIYSKDIK